MAKKKQQKGLLKEEGLKALIGRPGRHPDGGGLYFRTIGEGRAYFVYRYSAHGKGREMSLGPWPELTLDQARIRHLRLRADVAEKIDPLGNKQAAKTGKTLPPSGVPTFGAMAEAHVETHEGAWRNAKHRRQWRQTLVMYCQPIWRKPVNEVATADILEALKPIWATKQATAARLRGRIEVVLDAAQALGHVAADKANPARWRGHLDKLLPKPKKLSRGHHAALPYKDVPALMAKLAKVDSVASLALRFTILTACRSGEVLHAQWEEADIQNTVWRIPASRMKMQKPHDVPLSGAALAILRVQAAERGKNPHVFPGARPRQPLSHMGMSLTLKKLSADATVHGCRSSFRDWAADTGVAFEVAEACLAHSVGNAVTAAYLRTSMLERRRPIMEMWSRYLNGEAADNVVSIRSAVTA